MSKFKRSAFLLTCILSLQIIKPTTSLYANTMTLTYDGKQHTYNKPPITLEIDDNNIAMTMPPVQIDGRTLVPTREVFEPMGASVEWKSAEKKVFINHGDKLIVLEVDNLNGWIEGESKPLDVPPKIINDKLMLPLRFIGETLGFKVDWDHNTSHIKINQIKSETVAPDIEPPISVLPQLKTKVEDVRARNHDDYSTYTIYLESPLDSFNHFSQTGKLVVDIDSAKNALPSDMILADNPYVDKVRTSQFKADQTRVVFDLKNTVDSAVELAGDKKSIIISMGNIKPGAIIPQPIIPEPTIPEVIAPEQIELKNFKYTSNPREAIVFKKAPGLLSEGIHIKDDYRNNKLTISLPGNYGDFYENGQLNIRSRALDTILISSNSNTEFTIHVKKIREYSIIDEGDTIRIILMDPKEKHENIILLDMGHGAQDSGASANGLSEKKLNLEQGLMVYNLLQGNPNIKVYMTREDDSYPTNSSRAKLANDIGADIFVSLHHNAFTSPTANGTEVLYSTKDPKSKQVAQIFQNNLVRELGTFDRKIKPRPRVVVLNQTNMPAVLIETAFLTSPADAQKLQSPEFKENAARVIYDSIVEVFNTLSFR